MAGIVILGTGGHANAVRHWLIPSFLTARLTDDDDDVMPWDTVHIGLGDIAKRKRLYGRYRGQIPDMGRQIMRGADICPSAALGENVLVNTGAVVDHDCVIGDHCHIAPGAVLCGSVTLGTGCFIGAGAIVIQGTRLDNGTFVAAGSLVCGPCDFRRPVRVVRD